MQNTAHIPTYTDDNIAYTASQLGRLERKAVRSVWTNEARDFTPWLAQPDNILLLSETLGITLELESREKPVGIFSADILCKDVDTGHWVLIENQLERTDHVHLGQLLTYAAGLDAVTIIWIADRFSDEHRAALDWLNRITCDEVRLFGLEIELWRIGDSIPAPKFNIVAKPNDWTQSIVRAARALDESELSELRLMQREYWSGLTKQLEARKGPVAGKRKPQAASWMGFPTGRSRFHLNAVMVRPKNQIRAELYLGGVHAKTYFKLLFAQKDAIERELGYPLQWEELPQGQDSRISSYLDAVDVEDRDTWPKQHQWLADRLNDMHRVFAPRITKLEAEPL